MSEVLARALSGATVVTPNRRLARYLIDAHDRAQLGAGRLTWPTAQVLPWPVWIGAMEAEAVVAGALPPLIRLSPQASAHLWRSVVGADELPSHLVDALAASAEEAWEHVHTRGAGGESWRAWAGADDEPAAFARWAERYRAALATHGATDTPTSTERVARAARAMPSWRGRRFAFAGFASIDPQARRLLEALTTAGAEVEELATLADRPGPVRRAEFASTDDELVAALAWARREVERQPTASVGIVVPDLAGRLAAVRACAGEIVGVPADGGVSSPAWNVSLGAPIGATSLAGTAVDLIFLAWTHLPAGRAAALLRSASLAGADHEARWRRAGIERRWLDDGVGRVSLGDAIAAVEQIGDRLAQRLASLRPVVAKIRRAARREWVDAWREVLRIAGWPGDHPLSSDEHQVSEAFEGVLVAFAALDSVAAAAGAISAEQALASIAELCAATPFQPESPSAPIQILGLLEAIGLPFDTLWITGMSSAAWPRPVRPHPLLPIVWQRERGVPRSDPAGELAWAAAVTAGFERAAPVVIASHARNTDDGPLTGSSLFAHAEAFAPEVPATPAQAIFAARPARERLVERRVPAPAPGERHRRGSGLIEAQSACPFQAVAAMRWRADPWPSPVVGLTALERGTLVHETLAAFWRSTRDQAGLNALVADASRYSVAREDAARVAIGKLAPARWLGVPPAVRRIERRRLIRALDGWLRSVEVARPPFRVALVEHEERLALGALELDLRLDRLDELEDGGVAIVDYKTGRSGSPAKWTTDRPEATQLALYTLARRASHPDAPVRAAVLGQIRPGEWKAVGVYADRQARWAGDRGRAERIVDWPAHEARWDALVRGLAGEFLEGHAGVAPRDANACRTCARQSLCRVGELVAPGDEDDL